MENVFKGIALVSLMSVSTLTFADWTVSGGYTNFNEDDEGLDISVGAIYASAGYEFESGKATFMPELRIGVGVGDDSVQGIDVEIDNFIALSIRGQYNVTDAFGVFLQPSYGRLEITASGFGESITEDDWEFGFGGGAIYQFSDKAAVELIYEDFDGTDVLSLGVRFKF